MSKKSASYAPHALYAWNKSGKGSVQRVVCVENKQEVTYAHFPNLAGPHAGFLVSLADCRRDYVNLYTPFGLGTHLLVSCPDPSEAPKLGCLAESH